MPTSNQWLVTDRKEWLSKPQISDKTTWNITMKTIKVNEDIKFEEKTFHMSINNKMLDITHLLESSLPILELQCRSSFWMADSKSSHGQLQPDPVNELCRNANYNIKWKEEIPHLPHTSSSSISSSSLQNYLLYLHSQICRQIRHSY